MIDKIFEVPNDKEEIKQLFKENKIKKYDTLKIRCVVCNTPFDWTIIRYDRLPKVCSKNCQCKLMRDKQYNEIYNTEEKRRERAKKSILKPDAINKRVETQLKNGHLANNGNITMTKKWENTTKEERLNILKNEMLSKESIKKSRETESIRTKELWNIFLNNDKDNKDYNIAEKRFKKFIENGGSCPNFTFKDDVRFYKGIEVHEFSDKILSGELNISDYPGINIRFDKVHYYTEDIISGNINKLDHNFIEKDNILFYKGKEWNSYKNSFKNEYVECDNFNEYNGFYQNTYRIENNSITGQDAMEQELVEKNIGWFVYIKFYKDKENNIKPLVVGKSGSKLVNLSGSDIKFDLKEDDDRSGRKFLNEEGLDWYKDKIYIIPCNSEEESFELEKLLQEKYNLFSS